jgi:hypothetical protein
LWGNRGVMPGKMQGALEQLLSCAGTVSRKPLKYPEDYDVAASDLRPEIERVYRSLGGVLQSIPLNLRPWDLEFDGIAVELDESLHFNRYRGVILRSASYARLPRFPLDAYQHYCSEREEICLKNGSYGKKWSSPSAEAQFGPASQPKELSGNGSPRWKQRAFYDFVKDLSPLLMGVKVARVAVWDELVDADGTKRIGKILSDLVGQSAPRASARRAALRLRPWSGSEPSTRLGIGKHKFVCPAHCPEFIRSVFPEPLSGHAFREEWRRFATGRSRDGRRSHNWGIL